MPRGGRRAGAPGKAYGNRTDLNQTKLPAASYPMGGNQGYGEQKAMMDAQAAVPVASPPSPGPSAPPQAGPLPGGLGDFARPSDRPHEPLTHGLPTGPGGGPEVLKTMPTAGARNLLQAMAQQPYASDDIRMLLNILQG